MQIVYEFRLRRDKKTDGMRAAIKCQMKLFDARKFLLYFLNELRGVLKFFRIG